MTAGGKKMPSAELSLEVEAEASRRSFRDSAEGSSTESAVDVRRRCCACTSSSRKRSLISTLPPFSAAAVALVPLLLLPFFHGKPSVKDVRLTTCGLSCFVSRSCELETAR